MDDDNWRHNAFQSDLRILSSCKREVELMSVDLRETGGMPDPLVTTRVASQAMESFVTKAANVMNYLSQDAERLVCGAPKPSRPLTDLEHRRLSSERGSGIGPKYPHAKRTLPLVIVHLVVSL